jgi:hypothetical protein
MHSPSLTTAQNADIQQRFNCDEIARLDKLRPGKERMFERFGETRVVERVTRNGIKRVYARGVWKRMRSREVRSQFLDE